MSEGRPVVLVDVDYDDRSGFYVDASGSLVFRHGSSPAPLSLQLIGGYAKRLSSGTTIDFGVTHSNYSHYSNGRGGESYSEAYAGVAHGFLSSRIFISPHYFTGGRWTAYGEVNANFSPAPNWSLEAHAGVLTVLRNPSAEPYRSNFDWRVGVGRRLGPISLHAAWVGHGRTPEPFGSSRRGLAGRNALVVGVTAPL